MTALRAWALAIVPCMIVLPVYVFPIRLHRPIGVYDGRRFIEIAWIGVIALTLLAPSVRSAAVRVWTALPQAARWAAAGLVATTLLSALLASLPAYALRSWALMTLLLVATLPLAALLAPIRSTALDVLGLTLVFYAVIVIPEPLYHGFTNPRFQGQMLAVAAPALLFAGRLPLALMVAPALALGLISGSRALVLTLALVTMAPFLWSDRRKRLVAGALGLILTGAVFAGLLAVGTGEAVGAAMERGTSTNNRLLIWRHTAERFIERPILGIGPEMLAREPGILGVGAPAHPHNSVMLILGETGLVGLACVAVLVWLALKQFRTLPPDRRPWALGLLSGGLHSMFSGTIIMPASQSLLVLALALALPDGETAVTDRRKTSGWALAAAAVASLVVLLANLSLPPAELSTLRHWPRFFLQGIIP